MYNNYIMSFRKRFLFTVFDSFISYAVFTNLYINRFNIHLGADFKNNQTTKQLNKFFGPIGSK